MGRNEQELEKLKNRLSRLRPAVDRILRQHPEPDELIQIAEGNQGRAWFWVGTHVADLAQLVHFTRSFGPHRSVSAKGDGKPDTERLRVWVEDANTRKYLGTLISKFFAHEIADFRRIGRSWCDGARTSEASAPESVAQVLESFWELLVAADFCQQHRLLGRRHEEGLRKLQTQLRDGYKRFPSKTRKRADFFLENFRAAVEAKTVRHTDRSLDGLAAEVLAPLSSLEPVTTSEVE